MKITNVDLWTTIFGLFAGNFLYSAMGDHNYNHALANTILQLTAIGVLWLNSVLFKRMSK